MLNGDGAFILVDGQFGSTGKGLLASYLARWAHKISIVVTSGGSNSGHTFYTHDTSEKVVLKHLPTLAVAAKYRDIDIPVYLSPGAIVDPDILNQEVEWFGIPVMLAATATVISHIDKDSESSGTIAAVAGTRQGVGAALVRKIQRDPNAIVRDSGVAWHPFIRVVHEIPDWRQFKRPFLEVSQGFSLGYHSQFYPKVTSRECTAAQGMADARIPPHMVNQVLMVIRTFPIRVGNHEGFSSGDWYPDQKEVSFSEIGQPEELTTVTKRVRRIATFSGKQYEEALLANRPAVVLVNFMNYISDRATRVKFAQGLRHEARRILGREPKFLYGYGPRISDITTSVR
jgi:adenylosuccinate synthase